MALALGSAGPALAQKVTLDVLYAQPGFAKYHEPIAQAFMKAHPDIEIKFRAPAGCITSPAGRRTTSPGS
jgi:multiple sugar transport system substrate-binding protein